MTDIMSHRGPDANGFYIGGGAGLGHRRLSIIDLATGAQPLSNEDGTVWVTFNGEIYNFAEVRRELQQAGHRFRTNSDTEVIVHAYEQWGDQSVERLRGMFAYALWDERRRRLVLVRDRVGVKPLYYSAHPAGITFGSEIKALLEDPDVPREWSPEAIDAYLALQYVPCPQTIYRSIWKLPAGHMLIAESGRATIRRYWDLTFTGDGDTAREAEYLDRLDALVSESVKLRLVSDVPLGAFLSGGIDSSPVVAAMTHERPASSRCGHDVGRLRRERVQRARTCAGRRQASRRAPIRAHRPPRRRRPAAQAGVAFRRAVRRFVGCADVLRVGGGSRTRHGRPVGRRWRRRATTRVTVERPELAAPPTRFIGSRLTGRLAARLPLSVKLHDRCGTRR